MSTNNLEELNLGTWSGIDLRLIQPIDLVNGKTYALLDLSRNSVFDAGDALSHASLDQLFNTIQEAHMRVACSILPDSNNNWCSCDTAGYTAAQCGLEQQHEQRQH